MDHYLYLGKSHLTISDVLDVENTISKLKGIQITLGDVIHFEFEIKEFISLNWDHFESFSHYSIEARFTEPGLRSIERLVTLFKKLNESGQDNICGTIRYNAKGVKASRLNPNEILIYRDKYPKKKLIIGFRLQKNSPHRKYWDGVVLEGNKNDEFYTFIRELSGNPFQQNPTNSLYLEQSELEYELIRKSYEYLGEKITAVSWRVGLFGNIDEILPRLRDLFEEKPDADKCKASFTASFSSYLALEEIRKIITHKTNFVIPMGKMLLNEGREDAAGFMLAVRVMEKGYQFVTLCEQPLNAETGIPPEIQSYLDLMGIDKTRATTLEKILKEVHSK